MIRDARLMNSARTGLTAAAGRRPPEFGCVGASNATEDENDVIQDAGRPNLGNIGNRRVENEGRLKYVPSLSRGNP